MYKVIIREKDDPEPLYGLEVCHLLKVARQIATRESRHVGQRCFAEIYDWTAPPKLIEVYRGGHKISLSAYAPLTSS